MKTLFIVAASFVFFNVLGPVRAIAECDQFVDNILTKHLKPAIESANCAVINRIGLDKPGHRLINVCYQSSGANSHIRIDAVLNCHASDESVMAHLFGRHHKPSVSEDVTAEADVRGSDCHLNYVTVKASGEMGKLIAYLFDANGRANVALEQGLAEVCSK